MGRSLRSCCGRRQANNCFDPGTDSTHFGPTGYPDVSAGGLPAYYWLGRLIFEMKLRSVLILVGLTAALSTFIGGVLSYEFLRRQTNDVLKVKVLEIEDANGLVRGRLGTEADGGVFLRFVSPEQKAVLSLGEVGPHPNADLELESAPLIQMNDKDGRRSVTMTTFHNGNGILAFDSETRWNTLLLGYFPVDEDVASSPPLFEWGLAVSHNYEQTGVGIADQAPGSSKYLAPQTPHK